MDLDGLICRAIGLRSASIINTLKPGSAQMYVYIEFEPGTWTVGFYTPTGEWIAESDHNDIYSAAARVAYLNGTSRT